MPQASNSHTKCSGVTAKTRVLALNTASLLLRMRHASVIAINKAPRKIAGHRGSKKEGKRRDKSSQAVRAPRSRIFIHHRCVFRRAVARRRRTLRRDGDGRPHGRGFALSQCRYQTPPRIFDQNDDALCRVPGNWTW